MKTEGDRIAESRTSTINVAAGAIDIAPEWGIDELFLTLNRSPIGPEDRSHNIQGQVRKHWQAQAMDALAAGTLDQLLTEVEQRTESLTFPKLPTSQVPVLHRAHLKLACRAAAWDYVQRVRSAQGIG